MATTDFDIPGGSMTNMSYLDAGNSASDLVAASEKSRGNVFLFTGVSALANALVGKSGTAFGVAKKSSSRIDYLCVSAGQYFAIGQISITSPYTVTIKWKSY